MPAMHWEMAGRWAGEEARREGGGCPALCLPPSPSPAGLRQPPHGPGGIGGGRKVASAGRTLGRQPRRHVSGTGGVGARRRSSQPRGKGSEGKQSEGKGGGVSFPRVTGEGPLTVGIREPGRAGLSGTCTIDDVSSECVQRGWAHHNPHIAGRVEFRRGDFRWIQDFLPARRGPGWVYWRGPAWVQHIHCG